MSLSITPEIIEPFTDNNIFIETGTFTGGGVAVALWCGYKKVISIEIEDKYFYAVRDRYQDDKRVELYLGDSVEVLPKIMENLKEPATIFLDSHLASGNNIGQYEVPLLIELDIIKAHPIKTHTILIDDVRGFGYNENIDPYLSKEWKQITVDIVKDRLLEINEKYTVYFVSTTNSPNDLMVANIQGDK